MPETTTTTTTTTTMLAPSILEPLGTVWSNNSSLTNSFGSATSGITDFTIFNPYIHNSKVKNNVVSINTNGLLQFSTLRFNKYLDNMRTAGPVTVTSTSTTPKPFTAIPKIPGF